jgi:L-threonylcarbamoyladenylate synthase
MSRSPVVSIRDVDHIRRALADEQVIALPGVGGYCLAAWADRERAVQRLEERSGRGDESRPHYVVGHRDQAQAVTSAWPEEARRLADRCWPGPLTLILAGPGQEPVRVSMASSRPLRRLCQGSGPWRIATLGDTSAATVADHFSEADVTLVVDGGVCDGPGATLVDCTRGTVQVIREGALPANFIEAALIMGAPRRRWFAKRTGISGAP